MTVGYLALGSNLGDRAQNLRDALSGLQKYGLKVVALSKIYASESVEGGGPNPFLNAAVRLETDLSALQLLDVVRAVESELGRPQDIPGRHRGGSRVIDIDILFFGAQVINSPQLELPHPRLHRRAFVLKPLLDVLEGGWVHESTEDWKL